MRYTLTTTAAPFDLAVLRTRITDEDPAAVVDADATATTLRVATVLTEAELHALAAGDTAAGTVRLRREPSECCGGCGG